MQFTLTFVNNKTYEQQTSLNSCFSQYIYTEVEMLKMIVFYFLTILYIYRERETIDIQVNIGIDRQIDNIMFNVDMFF